MADLTDERGNPIQLTDEFGNPVTLTDEHGNPMHLSGVAYSPDAPLRGGPTSLGATIGGLASRHGQMQPRRVEEVGVTSAAAQIRHFSSSSSTSSGEELGEGESVEGEEGGTRRRRKKKGITQKLKEKLNLAGPETKETTTAAAAPHKIATTDTATQKMTVEHVEKEKGGAFVASDTTTTAVTTEHRDQAKRGVIERIMEKLPGHHTTH